MSVNAIEKALWDITAKPGCARAVAKDAPLFLGDYNLDDSEVWLLAAWDLKGLVAHGVHPMILMMAYAAVNGPAAAPGYVKRLHDDELRYPGRFAGKVAVVTGAAQGIGFEVARRMGREGASVVVVDIAPRGTEIAMELLSRAGVNAISVLADLSTLAGAEQAMQAAVDRFGGLDIVVNNVGGAIHMKPFWYFTEEEMRAEVDRTLWPALMCCRAAIPHLKNRVGAAIVNVGSNAAEDGFYRIPYSACKGAVESLTKSLAVELAGFGIRVNCMSPGGTMAPARKTPRGSEESSDQQDEWMQQFIKLVGREELMSPHATAEEQSAVITFLASTDASHMTGEILQTGRRGARMKEVLGCMP